ncbi:NAD-dependent epimerase/dehydratase family protein [Streptomyces sp. NPDC014894]|uniref:NAD-dependent epimerase/dehydratase family protein n=1 Tax=unclassified Streptomyces TaxID=2593676 RepID=UPI0036F85CD6
MRGERPPEGPGRVVVLGGTGFVGRGLCADFAARGWDVLAVARRAPGGSFPARFLGMDLAEVSGGELAETLEDERPDAVVNATGSIWSRNDAEMDRICTVPALRLLEALGKLSGRPRLVHLGSVLEYGPIRPGDTAGPRLRPRPSSAYGRAKLAASRAVLDAAGTGSVDALVLRIANVAGAGAPEVSLLGAVARQLLAGAAGGEPVTVALAPLTAHRDYVDVRDVCDAVVAATRSRATGTAVDIGRGEAVPVRTLVELLIGVSGVPARIVETPPDPGRPPEAEWLRVDPRPARELLGWRPRRSLAEAVAGFWEDVRARTA